MEKKSKKSVLIGITSLFLVTLILLGLTYAYYRTRIIGNESTDPSISVTSKKLEVTYSDDKAVIEAEGIAPGFTATKTFTVTNTGSEITNFAIILDNVENTFTRKKDWTFVLKQGDNVIKEGIVPSSKTYIVNTISIAEDETIEYTLTINYANLTNVDQSEDMDSTLSFRVNIDNETGIILESAAEGTLLKAIANDNLISEPLTVPGKAASGTIYNDTLLTNEEVIERTVPESRKDNYIIYASSYEFDETNGLYRLTDVKTGKYSEVYTELAGKYVASSDQTWWRSDEPTESLITLRTTNRTGFYKILEDPAPTLTSYSAIKEREYTESVMEEAVLASTEDDYGTSYYYRGTVENNYVTYSNMCWRIVRVQGNGTIKLVLADGAHPCGTANGYSAEDEDSAFINSKASYFEWGNSIDYMLFEKSNIPSKLSTWASDFNLDTSKLVETEWCNDLSVAKDNSSGYDDETGEDIFDKDLAGDTWSYGYEFGASKRLSIAGTGPSLKCNHESVELHDTTFQEILKATKYKNILGILSADEIVFAGERYASEWDKQNYLRVNALRGNHTMTPYDYMSDVNDADSMSFTYQYYYSGVLDDGTTDYNFSTDESGFSFAVRPSVVLRSDVLLGTTDYTQNGTQDNPYVIG